MPEKAQPQTIEKLMRGSIDMHIHPAPDLEPGRRNLDALQIALQAQDAGMKAIVLKSHYYATAPLAAICARVAPNIAVFGSFCIDIETGGLSVEPAEVSAKLGGKILWMPTLSSKHYRGQCGLQGGLTVLDDTGQILPVVTDILEMVKSYDMALASGHLSFTETIALFDEARRLGLKKLVATHPLTGLSLSIPELKELAERGAYVEYLFRPCLPGARRFDPAKIAECAKAIGAERCVMGTDLAQVVDPPPAEGMRMFIGTMLRCDVSEKELGLMVKVNPSKLLGLD